MFEGNEAEGKLGSGGGWALDVSDKGICKASMSYGEGAVSAMMTVEMDLIVALEQLAVKTDNKIDDSMVAMIKGALGRV